MNEELDVEGNRCLLLPRPWLTPDATRTRAKGAMQLWSFGEHVYVKGLVGTRVLPYWHRVVGAENLLSTEVASPRRVVIPM